MSKVRKVVLVILTVLALMIIGAYAFLQVQLGKINRVTAGETEFTTEDFEEDTDAEDSITDVDWGETSDIETMEGVFNILLVGQDTRVSGQRARSDSMIILTIDTNNNRLAMTSIMRDLYVQIPDYNGTSYSNNKINAAYAFGGFELLDATIETNFGVQIDYNVEVDFEGFKDIIDAIGGIEIELSQAEVDYLSNNSNTGSISGLQVGMNLLDGEAALAYARTRYVNTSTSHDDFGRTERQRIVIQTVFQKVKDQPWTDLLSLYNTLAGCLTTDMTNDQILSMALTVYQMGADSIDEYRVPEDGAYTSETIRKMSVLVPTSWDLCRANLQEFIYGTSSSTSTTSTSITSE